MKFNVKCKALRRLKKNQNEFKCRPFNLIFKLASPKETCEENEVGSAGLYVRRQVTSHDGTMSNVQATIRLGSLCFSR